MPAKRKVFPSPLALVCTEHKESIFSKYLSSNGLQIELLSMANYLYRLNINPFFVLSYLAEFFFPGLLSQQNPIRGQHKQPARETKGSNILPQPG